MKWIKSNDNGIAVGVDTISSIQFDHPRPATGVNRYQRQHGQKVYFESDIHKYLNTASEDWKNISVGDMDIRYTGPGFLSRFDDTERKLLVPHTVKVEVPVGYNKKYGKTMEKNVLAALPSAEQLGTRREAGTLGLTAEHFYTWVREAGTMNQYVCRGYTYPKPCNSPAPVCPIIKLKDDAPVDTQIDGSFIIRIPEPDFTGDIEAFLGISIAA